MTAAVPAIALLLAAGCSGDASNKGATPAAGQRALRVVTTIYPLMYFASRLSGDGAEVVSLIRPGVAAHDFEPRPSDVRLLEKADVIVYNSRLFETWMERALEAISADANRVVIEAARAGSGPGATDEDLDEDSDEPMDAHVWLDPVRALEQVRVIAAGVRRARPSLASELEANQKALEGELSALDHVYRAALEGCQMAAFVTSHDSFGWLAARYGLEQIPLAGLSPMSEAGPRRVAEITDQVRELGIDHILAEPVVSAALAEAVAREVGIEVLQLHPIESLTPEEEAAGADYFSVMSTNLTNLTTALECPA